MPSNKRETTPGFREGRKPSIHQTFMYDLKSVIAFLSNAEKYYTYICVYTHTPLPSIILYICVCVLYIKRKKPTYLVSKVGRNPAGQNVRFWFCSCYKYMDNIGNVLMQNFIQKKCCFRDHYATLRFINKLKYLFSKPRAACSTRTIWSAD